MLKVFYLKDGYVDPNFRESNFLNLVVNGIGGRGILIKDFDNKLSYSSFIKRDGIKDDTDEFDSYNSYVITTKIALKKFLEVFNCKVLYTSETTKITEDEAIELLYDNCI